MTAEFMKCDKCNFDFARDKFNSKLPDLVVEFFTLLKDIVNINCN